MAHCLMKTEQGLAGFTTFTLYLTGHTFHQPQVFKSMVARIPCHKKPATLLLVTGAAGYKGDTSFGGFIWPGIKSTRAGVDPDPGTLTM